MISTNFKMKIKAIINGVAGMAGDGVLRSLFARFVTTLNELAIAMINPV
jgi:hypothetical protein